MKLFNKIFRVALSVVFFICSNTALACAFHGGNGFGSPFPNHRPYPGALPQKQKDDASEKWVTLTYASMITAKVNEKVELNVDYKALPPVKNVQLSLEATSNHVTLKMPTAQIESESGTQTFTVTPSNSGLFKLTIVASANDESGTKTQREVVYLYVTQHST